MQNTVTAPGPRTDANEVHCYATETSQRWLHFRFFFLGIGCGQSMKEADATQLFHDTAALTQPQWCMCSAFEECRMPKQSPNCTESSFAATKHSVSC